MEENSKCPSPTLVRAGSAPRRVPSAAPRARSSACRPWPKNNHHNNNNNKNICAPGLQGQRRLGPRPGPSLPAFAARPRRCGGRSARVCALLGGDGGEAGSSRPGLTAARFYRGVPLLCPPLPASQVLQGGGLESPTKPKGRPKKNSIPSSEQLSEQERARDAEKPPESLGSPAEVSQEE